MHNESFTNILKESLEQNLDYKKPLRLKLNSVQCLRFSVPRNSANKFQ